MKKCDLEFVPDDGSDPLTCGRDGWHIVHQEPATGTRHVRVPGGAYVTHPTK
ncbi:hypothetical protein OG589_14400 [Sphaerisporangium sp. NBC_01403]|uniref:hypothetical protein n=1 Tax=Sphaerisporangium sp. NBC_01403 TaxID=2903599 RepID=UPI00324E8936